LYKQGLVSYNEINLIIELSVHSTMMFKTR